jgi:protein TonB
MFHARERLALFALVVWLLPAFSQEGMKRLSRAEALNAIASKTVPEYPPVARQLKMEGSVDVEAEISEEGTVLDVRIVTGNPVLTKAAVQAVRKWRFTPVTQGGKAIKALAPITVIFKL